MKKGDKVFVRSVTNFYTGEIVKISKSWIELRDAAWIADTGRFSDALKNGTLNEVEPYPSGVVLSRGAIVDVSPWLHNLPRDQK